MVVIVYRGRDGSIVVVPFVAGDLAITVLVTERREEFNKNFFAGHFSALDLGVERGVVDGGQVSGGDSAVTVGVELAEGFLDVGHSQFVRASADSDEEFIVVDLTILVGVEVINENFRLAL